MHQWHLHHPRPPHDDSGTLRVARVRGLTVMRGLIVLSVFAAGCSDGHGRPLVHDAWVTPVDASVDVVGERAAPADAPPPADGGVAKTQTSIRGS